MSKKAKRNDPCPCGSGKKYKKCCYSKDSDKSFSAKIMTGKASNLSSLFSKNLSSLPKLSERKINVVKADGMLSKTAQKKSS